VSCDLVALGVPLSSHSTAFHLPTMSLLFTLSTQEQNTNETIKNAVK
jgi:hypothetical protein